MEVKCTQCGGAVPIIENQGLAACPFCSSSLYVDVSQGVGHFLVKPVLKEENAARQLITFLENKERRGDLKVSRTSLIFWPFWRIQTVNEETVTSMAAAHPVTAMENASFPPGSMSAFREEELGNAFAQPPQEPLKDFIERSELEPKHSLLVHVPFLQVRYVYNEIEYEAWIDAVRGDVFADDLPPTYAKEKDKLYLRAMAVIFAVYLIIGAIFKSGDMAVVVMFFASIPLFYIIKSMVGEEVS